MMPSEDGTIHGGPDAYELGLIHGARETRRQALTALLNARDRRPFALWSLAKVIELVDEATR